MKKKGQSSQSKWQNEYFNLGSLSPSLWSWLSYMVCISLQDKNSQEVLLEQGIFKLWPSSEESSSIWQEGTADTKKLFVGVQAIHHGWTCSVESRFEEGNKHMEDSCLWGWPKYLDLPLRALDRHACEKDWISMLGYSFLASGRRKNWLKLNILFMLIIKDVVSVMVTSQAVVVKCQILKPGSSTY